ncbi:MULTISPECIES: iron-sulfur cluster assembly scaffold protein [unclassified Rathayibacter]|uniref:iron-sulfur cluster assembly scaffold protein n=1 Tax=unclassified Rathayibacter TaxID=2609250 RepID=UPI001FB4A1F0|nr:MULTISPECIES: iron-sulfur cluster assembly scaffold protein [unclassified Rathayibacter]MCJ1673145.1 iron-sulfur cluster assembly scaffold protein [Rathayibacter sp. VKM Ac-2929]MCJ1682644.1 iron-sulfur cluster assembly scaffold protein [Rathayibacter sp. VKM Ac-2928]MCJ1685426.1 iron-sulfur cluster assembly scaffold protein [Rathayibacter sp. VKM Ac-2927]
MSAEAAELIRAHARHPVGRDDAMPAGVLGRAELLTPTCGDRIEVRVSGDATALAISWSGRGCEVSQGSASLLADELDGLDAVTARGRVAAFLDAMAAHDAVSGRGADPDGPAGQALGDEAALLLVAANPVRSVCAALAWRALRDALDVSGLG